MRNIFDQYGAPENRLSHALGCCLQRDRRFLRNFIGWATGRRELAWRGLQVVEQHIPGTPIEPSKDGEASLPDLWIHGDGAWSLIVESKVMARVEAWQLHRHRNMARRNGFTDVNLLVLATAPPVHRLEGVIYKTWPEVYAWSRKQARESAWATYLADYMEVAEARMAADGYLTEGTITNFSGIHFGPDYPYAYGEAKRVLKLALAELRKDKRLKKLGMDPAGKGRPAITGKDGTSVWDFVPLRQARGGANFTSCPHLTLAIQLQRIVAIVTLPSAVPSQMRRNLTKLEEDGFRDLIRGVEAQVSKAVRTVHRAYPFIETVQRYYPSQKSEPIAHARIEFDLRTAAATRKSAVRIQPQWLDAVFHALCHKRSNLQVGIGAVLPYGDPRLRSREVLDLIAGVWIGCRPWIETILNRRPHAGRR